MSSPLLNSRFELPADHWYHIVPLGEFHHAEGDLLQVIDDRAIRSMVDRFQRETTAPNFPGLLVDFDHASHHADQPTEAAGWITQLHAVTRHEGAANPHQAPGLWAQIRWSDSGEAAVRGGRYRLVSPVWLAEDCEPLPVSPTNLTRPAGPASPASLPTPLTRPAVRPLRLHRLALTNDPNLRGLVPLSNRSAASAPLPENERFTLSQGQQPVSLLPILDPKSCLADADSPQPPASPDPQLSPGPGASLSALPPLSPPLPAGNDARRCKPQTKTMQTIRVALGLAAEAAEEAVLAEIAQLKNRAAQAETRALTAEQQAQELLSAQIEHDLDHYARRFVPEAREKWKAALLANRNGTLELLNSLPDPDTDTVPPGTGRSHSAAPLHHRAGAGLPACSLTPGHSLAAHNDARLQAVREYQNRHHCTWQIAWNTVRNEHPEWF